MICTAALVEKMIAEAASLSERIAGGLSAPDAWDEAAEARLQAWIAQSSQGNPEKFLRRLVWDGIDLEGARRIVGSRACTLETDPAWAAVVRELMEFLTARPSGADTSIEESVRPFVHALTPLADFAMDRLQRQAPAGILAPEAGAHLRTQLLDRLSEICCLTLGEEFLQYRNARGASAGIGETSTTMYREFAAGIRDGGLQLIFQSYPVLGRLVATAIDHFACDNAFFLIRLEADLPELERRFFGGRALPPVHAIAGSLSDPHNQGRTVRIVTFEDGSRVVFKPKSLAIDNAWRDLTTWLHRQESTLDLRAPLVWDRGEYGWAEYIQSAECQTPAELSMFYRRAGALVCLFYVIHATDFHHENLIAAGAHLVPIDLETLFVPDLRVLKKDSSRVSRNFWGTALRSYLLPQWQAAGGAAIDTSGIGSFAQDQPMGETLGWLHINTDAMYYGRQPGYLRAAANLPALDGTTHDPSLYLAEMADGFACAYRALVRQREDLLTQGGVIEAFRRTAVRVIVRSTRIYGAMLDRSLAPRFLRNGIDRSLEFEGLARPFLAPASYDGSRIFRAELDSVERLDIPYFTASPESDALESPDGLCIAGVLDEPSFLAVTARLRSLDEMDLAYQLELLHSAFAARIATPAARRIHSAGGHALSPSEFVAAAEAIGHRLAQRAVWEGDAADWIGLDYRHDVRRYALQPLGLSLYGGRSGLVVFFAALHRVTGEERYRRLALGAAQSIARDLWGGSVDADLAGTSSRVLGIGGASGLGGIVYGLTAAGRLLAEPALLSDACRVAALISPEAIDGDLRLDVTAGSAGAMLGLLSLWRATEDQTTLARAARCAARLLSRQIGDGSDAGAWLTISPQPLAGYSHGAAGIAYALCSAYAATGDRALLGAAGRAVAFETSIFDPIQGNWPDRRDESAGPAMGAWCHGAPGIGLARLGCLQFTAGEPCWADLLRDLDVAASWLAAEPASLSDHLCCGEFGRIEMLLEAGVRTGRPEWIAAAHQRAGNAFGRAGGAEFWCTIGSLENNFVPGLFDGLSGIGYQMLRLAEPDSLPSVLLWE